MRLKRLKLGDHDPIFVDVKALRRRQASGGSDIKRVSPARKAASTPFDDDDMFSDMTDPLTAIIARARRKTRR